MQNKVLLEAVKQLNAEQQECIVLRFLQGLSVAETAQAMGKNDGCDQGAAVPRDPRPRPAAARGRGAVMTPQRVAVVTTSHIACKAVTDRQAGSLTCTSRALRIQDRRDGQEVTS
jgi:hypothetical protein